jgi:hypothetical protein
LLPMLQIVVYDIFTETFGNLFADAMFGVFILIGILLGVFLRPFVGNRVLKFDPEEHRFNELDVEEESAISIECKDQKGMPPQRFFKHHPGFVGIIGRFLKKPVTYYLGRTGTAYTWRLEQGTWKTLGNLAAALKIEWGEAFYNEIPAKQKETLEKSEIMVTVGLSDDPLTPEGKRAVGEEDIHREEDRAASRTFWKERFAKDRGMIINIILAAGMGFGVCAALTLLGIFKSPASTPAPAPTPQQPTAAVIYWLLSLVI